MGTLPLFPTRGKPRAYDEPKPPSPKEFALHRAVVDHLRVYARPDWRWTHFPAGERRDKRTAAKLKAMGLQPGWPDFLLLTPAAADRPGGLVHMLELKRRGEDLTKSQEDLAAWCAEQGVPFACNDDVRDAKATLSGWGVLRLRIAQ
jgi:hypothetical protein